jgi:dTDP-4-dehydrorhamnose reductase
MDKLIPIILGDGLLGKELVKQTKWDFVSRKSTGFNINDIENSIEKNKYNTIINCIGCTDTYSTEKEKHWDVNYVFLNNLIDYCNINNIKLIHICTDYIYTGSIINATEEDIPVHCNNWYGYTKLLGDGLVQLRSNDYLLCRCTHKPYPYPYNNGWINQIGNFDYVNIISELIIKCINKNLTGVYNIGTETKSIYELGFKTNNTIQKSFAPKKVPKNTTMNCSKMLNKLNNE